MVAKNIKDYLKAKGIRQTWLAEQLGIPNTTLNGYFSGLAQLKADMFVEICQILGEPPETFTEPR